MIKVILAIFVAALSVGCASTNSYDSSRSDAVPVNELGARGAKFAGQAQQFHRANMAIDLCPQGTAVKTGDGSVNSGAGDQNGQVTYSITTSSVANSKCDFGEMNPKPAPVAQPAAPVYQPAQAAQPQPAVQNERPPRGTRQQRKP